MTSWFEPAPAKVNLCLHVVGQRANGYHELESIAVFTQLGDEIEAKEAKSDHLHTLGPFAPALASERSNIILEAFALFRKSWPNSIPDGLAIKLNKSLPVAAGIGGGSADAAAALRMANHIAGDIAPAAELSQLALWLGADVPMCLFSRTCIVQGIGENLEFITPFPKLFMVLANPGIAVSTADIFRKLKLKNNPPLTPLPTEVAHSAALALWLQDNRNDLELPAIKQTPEIGGLIEKMSTQNGCILGRMSGSGATVFGLFAAEGQAMTAAQQLRQTFPSYWVAHSKII